jgi:ribonuclease P protein subunit RPR2
VVKLVPDKILFLRDTQLVMGKQKSNQEKGPNLSAVPNKDLMQRMNFLYQVASHLSQQSGPLEENSDVKPPPKGLKKAKKRNGTPQDLAAFHVRSMRAIGTKSMVKMRVASFSSI